MAIDKMEMLQVHILARDVGECANVSYYTFDSSKYLKGLAVDKIKELRQYLNTLDLE